MGMCRVDKWVCVGWINGYLSGGENGYVSGGENGYVSGEEIWYLLSG